MTSRIDVQETNPLLREATGRNPNSNTFPLKAVLAEVLGTALLANAVAMGTDALHVGLTLAALVFSLGHISGAHELFFNSFASSNCGQEESSTA